MSGFRRLLVSYARDESAVAVIEFAVLLPILIFCGFVLFEFISFQLARIRVDKAAYTLANAITQLQINSDRIGAVPYTYVSDAAVLSILNRADQLLPGQARGHAKVIAVGFSYVDRLANVGGVGTTRVNKPVLLWAKGISIGPAQQRPAPSTVSIIRNNTTYGSNLYLRPFDFEDVQTTNAINLYGNFSCDLAPEHAVLVEVFYEYNPLFSPQFIDADMGLDFFRPTTLSSRAFLRPRGADIEALRGPGSNFNAPSQRYINSKSRGFCVTP